MRLAEPLADLILKFITNQINVADTDLITAVPLHRNKLQKRGFNQSQIMAEIIAARLNLRFCFDNLYRRRRTASQFNLAPNERRKNVRGAFACKRSQEFKEKSILLIDDIFTTGSTLNECAYILKQAGARRVVVLTLAR